MPNDNGVIIAALLREREGYVRFGKDDKVPAVDAELARLGYRSQETKAPEPATPQAEETAPPPPSKAEPERASLEARETATVPRGRPRRSDPNG